MNDLRFAWRVLRKSPGFTAVAVLTLAVGIGACVSIFSVANAMLLRRLPYERPDRLVSVWQRDKTKEEFYGEVSVPNFMDWKQQANSFEQLAFFNHESLTLGAPSADATSAMRFTMRRYDARPCFFAGTRAEFSSTSRKLGPSTSCIA